MANHYRQLRNQMSRRHLVSYLFRLVLSCRPPVYWINVVWRRPLPLDLSRLYVEGQGILYVHPLVLLKHGLLANQMVKVIIEYQTGEAKTQFVERIFRIRTSLSIKTTQFLIGSDDRMNIFPNSTVQTATLNSLKLFKPQRSQSPQVADSIRIAPVKRTSTKTINYDEEFKQLLRTTRVLYKHDIVSVKATDCFTGKTEVLSFRVDSSESPFLADSSCAIYETAPVNCHSPFGGHILFHPSEASVVCRLPRPLQSVVDKTVGVINAYSKVSEVPLLLLLDGSPGNGKKLVINRVAALCNQNVIIEDCYDIWSEIPSQVEAKLKIIMERARSCQPCILHLTNVEVFGYDSNSEDIDNRVLNTFRSLLKEPSPITIVLSCQSDKLSQLSTTIRSLCLYHFTIDFLMEKDRICFLKQFKLSSDQAKWAAQITSGFVLSELNDVMNDVRYTNGDFEESFQRAVDKRNSSFADAIGAPKIPTVSWDDVGGLEEIKRTVIESIEGNLKGTSSIRRSGIVLFGPPGCGKTLIAKAVATEFKIAFLSVKGPELLNKYVGQSEENLRKVFERARQASPCVIFFDELDSLAPNRGINGDSGGVMDRIVSQLLSELDSLHSDDQSKVFVMAATNRADLLDPSLLSAGRFDKVVNVPPGTSPEAKCKILQAVSRNVKFDDNVDIMQIAQSCPPTMSGAELYSLISNATMAAIRQQINLVEKGKTKASDVKITVGQHDLESALNDLRSKFGQVGT